MLGPLLCWFLLNSVAHCAATPLPEYRFLASYSTEIPTLQKVKRTVMDDIEFLNATSKKIVSFGNTEPLDLSDIQHTSHTLFWIVVSTIGILSVILAFFCCYSCRMQSHDEALAVRYRPYTTEEPSAQ